MTLGEIPKDESESLKKVRAAVPNFDVYEWRHASAVLTTDYKSEWNDIKDVLSRFQLFKSQVVVGGGSKSQMAGWIDHELTANKGWQERKFETSIKIDQDVLKSPTHKVDCFKNKVGLEIEWNNKDPFFDRDLNNFRLLFDLRALAVGVIVTRCDELDTIFDQLTKSGLKPGSAFGESTTHLGKLLPRLEGGAGGGCPVLVFGISPRLYVEDLNDEEARALLEKVAGEKAAKKAEKANRKKKGLPSLDAEDESLQESSK
jgi:hypothetical protein